MIWGERLLDSLWQAGSPSGSITWFESPPNPYLSIRVDYVMPNGVDVTIVCSGESFDIIVDHILDGRVVFWGL